MTRNQATYLIRVSDTIKVHSLTFKLKQAEMSEISSTLRFHEIHGNRVQLSNNNTTAYLPANATSDILFSLHPLQPYEKFLIKVSEIPEKCKEIISIGFTQNHPSQHQQSAYSIKICSGRKQYRIKGKTLFFYFTPDGTIHFGVDNEEKGRHRGKIQTRYSLWAFVRILIAPMIIEVLNSQAFDWSSLNLIPLMLHPDRGRNVKLLQNIAHKFDRRLSTSYTFASTPVKVGEYVVIKILDVDSRSTGSLTLGLTSCNPLHLQKDNLPDDIESFLTRSEYWTLVSDPSWRFKQYDRISFVFNAMGEMRIWRNDSTLLKTVQLARSSKLWAFFDIAALEGVAVMSHKSSEFGEADFSSRYSEVKNNMLISENVGGDDDDADSCVVCCESVIEAAIYPCGHMSMCYPCAREQWRGAGHGKCPICRVVIKDVLKIFKI